jgi:hypothetical protein
MTRIMDENKKNPGKDARTPLPGKSEDTLRAQGTPRTDHPTGSVAPSTIRQAWMDYLARLPSIVGEPFEYVGHLTYRDHADIPRHHMAAIVDRRFHHFTGEINRRVYGKRWMRTGSGVWGVIATEKIPDFVHHHFIMGGAGLRANLRRLDIMDMWEELHGIARITDYRGEAAVRYLTKYVTKGGLVDVYSGAAIRQRVVSVWRMLEEAKKLKS